MQWVKEQNIQGIIDLTPVHCKFILIQFNSINLNFTSTSRSRVTWYSKYAGALVYLPLAWEDSQTQLATEHKLFVQMRHGAQITSSLF